MADELIHGLLVPIGGSHPVERISLIPGSKGVFEVRKDGSVLFSKAVQDRHPRPGEILSLVSATVQ